MTPRAALAFDGFGPFFRRIALVLAALGLVTLMPIVCDLLQAPFALTLIELPSA
jgi:hypothetical protein